MHVAQVKKLNTDSSKLEKIKQCSGIKQIFINWSIPKKWLAESA